VQKVNSRWLWCLKRLRFLRRHSKRRRSTGRKSTGRKAVRSRCRMSTGARRTLRRVQGISRWRMNTARKIRTPGRPRRSLGKARMRRWRR